MPKATLIKAKTKKSILIRVSLEILYETILDIQLSIVNTPKKERILKGRSTLPYLCFTTLALILRLKDRDVLCHSLRDVCPLMRITIQYHLALLFRENYLGVLSY